VTGDTCGHWGETLRDGQTQLKPGAVNRQWIVSKPHAPKLSGHRGIPTTDMIRKSLLMRTTKIENFFQKSALPVPTFSNTENRKKVDLGGKNHRRPKPRRHGCGSLSRGNGLFLALAHGI
jgi:hypothetical protein